MAGFRRGLCATDLSDAAGWAIPSARSEARLHGAEPLVLHLAPTPGTPLTPQSVEQALGPKEALARQIIEALVERIDRLTGRDAGQVTILVEEGAAEETIIRQADEVGADLVVVGSQGATNDRRVLFGRVAEKVARHAHVSVL